MQVKSNGAGLESSWMKAARLCREPPNISFNPTPNKQARHWELAAAADA